MSSSAWDTRAQPFEPLEPRVLLCAMPKGGVLNAMGDCGCGNANRAATVVAPNRTFSTAANQTLASAASASPAAAATLEDPGTKVPTITVGSVVNISRASGNQTEADLAINPTNPNQIFAVSNISTGNGLFTSRSSDGGVTWTTATIFTSGSSAACCDARVTYDKFGNLWMVYLNSNANSVIITRSTNNGASWTELLNRSGSWDNPGIAAGVDGQVWTEVRSSSGVAGIGWKATGLGTIDTTVGGGTGFTATQNVPGTTTSLNYGDIAVLNDGSVLIGWTNAGGQNQVTNGVARDPDGVGPLTFTSAIFSYTTNVGGFDFIPAQNTRSVDSEPNFAVAPPGSPFAGRVYLTYLEETVNENNDTDVMVRYSDNGGTNWSSPIRVNNDPSSPIRSQFLQQIAVDPTTGAIVASWHDARNDSGVSPTNGTNNVANDDAQFYGALSIDGGVTWQNFQIDPGWSNAAKAANGIDFGDWTGSDFYNGKFFAVWASNASNLANNPSTTQFDLATAAVTITGVSSNQSIAGAVFDDANGNGVRDGGESGLDGVTVYLDNDSSGTLTGPDTTTTTVSGGLYSFDSLANGTYSLRSVTPAGRRPTFPAGGSYTVTYSGTAITNRDFGYVNPRIAGTVFDDTNDNGVFDASELGLAGVTVYRDNDNSGTLTGPDTATTTDANGNYSLGGLANGTYTVRVVTPAGQRLTFPAGGAYTHTVTNAATVFTGDNFGLTNRGRINGFVYSDNNGNGAKDAGEAGLAGARVFQDINGNGAWDNVGGTFNSSDIPKSIPDNSSVQSSLTVSGVGNVTSVTVTLSISHTFDGDLVIKLISPAGTIVSLATNRGGSGDNFTSTTFSDAAATAISAGTAPFSGTFKPESVLSALIGENANGTWKLQVDDTATQDTGSLTAWSITLGSTEPSVLTAGDGSYAFPGLGAATYNLRQVPVTNYVFTAPSTGQQSVPVSAGAIATANFGNFPIAYTGSQMVLRLDPAGTNAQVWVDQPTTNPPTYTAAKTLLASKTLAFTGTAGNDSLTVDAGNGNPIPTSGGVSFNGLANTTAGDTLVILGKSTAGETVVFNNGSASINALPITQTGVENERFDGKGGGDALTVNGGPTVNIDGPQTLTTATLATGTTAAVTPGGNNLFVANTVSVAAGARLDVADNDMVLRAMTPTAVQALVAATYNAGNWDGTGGIGSSTAANDPTHSTALGYASNAQLGRTSFDGFTGLTANDVFVKYTYSGDANLDGQVDIGDLGLLSGSWQQPSGKTWFDGDFTFDGAVDIGDLGLLSGNWQKGVGNPI